MEFKNLAPLLEEVKAKHQEIKKELDELKRPRGVWGGLEEVRKILLIIGDLEEQERSLNAFIKIIIKEIKEANK